MAFPSPTDVTFRVQPPIEKTIQGNKSRLMFKDGMTENVIRPEELFSRLKEGWTMLLVFILCGGLLGLALSTVLTPIYQASTELETGIDYSRTLPLNQAGQARIKESVRALLLSDLVLGEVLNDLSLAITGDFNAEIMQLRSTLTLAERDGIWNLYVENRDAGAASLIANTWAETAAEEIKKSIKHAWAAASLQNSIYSKGCAMEIDPDTSRAAWRCNPGSDQDSPEDEIDELIKEAELSHGLLPGMNVSILQSSHPPVVPVARGRGMLILSGTAIGLIIGLVFTVYRKPSEMTNG